MHTCPQPLRAFPAYPPPSHTHAPYSLALAVSLTAHVAEADVAAAPRHPHRLGRLTPRELSHGRGGMAGRLFGLPPALHISVACLVGGGVGGALPPVGSGAVAGLSLGVERKHDGGWKQVRGGRGEGKKACMHAA